MLINEPDFSNAAVGDKVIFYTTEKFMFGVVKSVNDSQDYPIEVVFVCADNSCRTFTLSGRFHVNDILPSLFSAEPIVIGPPKKEMKMETVEAWGVVDRNGYVARIMPRRITDEFLGSDFQSIHLAGTRQILDNREWEVVQGYVSQTPSDTPREGSIFMAGFRPKEK